MKHLLLVVVTAITFLVVACAAPTPTPTPVPARLQTLRIELAADPDVSDVPRMMAADALRKMGYTIEPVDLNDNALSAQALEQGDLELGYISNGIAWAAVQKGAKLVTVFDDAGEVRILLTRADIQKCSDLNGKRVAVPLPSSTQALMLDGYLARTCREAQVERMVMSGTGARMAALLANQLEGATVDLDNLIELERQGDTSLHALAIFSDEFPGLRAASEVTSRSLTEKYPETVKDMIRAGLVARRQVHDPQVLSDALVKYLQMEPEQARTVAEGYLEQNVWDVNGGFTPEIIQENIDFLVKANALQPGLTPGDVADLSFLNAVLDEIGRK